MHKYITVENKLKEPIKIYLDGELQEPVVEGASTKRLTYKYFVGGAMGVVAKSSKDGKELWKKDYRGSEIEAIREGDELHIVVSATK